MIKKSQTSVFLLLILMIFSFSITASANSKEISYLDIANSEIDEEVLQAITPYLIPEDHPIKKQLDALFLSTRVLLNLKTLEAAGFQTTGPRRCTQVVVAFHSAFPDYVFKLFLDAQRYQEKIPLHEFWVQRVLGAQLIQAYIDSKGLHNSFKVPKKWIYIVPSKPAPPKEFMRKDFILVQDNMYILSKANNEKMWKSDSVSYELLKDFFFLLKNVGLNDLKPDNTPFSTDGRIAFVDTQTYLKRVYFYKMTHCLSPRNQIYWNQLYKTNKE